ncbi:MAG: NAD-dependent epimerase/dehydratase family protein [Pseudobacteriovorax sp.]|nr:NAD-dependent epimerase/dehydratase family protein [Pseudobacteriovorax sp.]
MKVFVTGGGGFLGSAIVKLLLARGDEVHTINRGRYPELEQPGVTCFRGSIANFNLVKKAMEGCDAVIHTAAKAGVWGAYREYYEANVVGTKNVVNACQLLKVPKLVYTSSPSVVFGGDDQEGIDESAPYPQTYDAHYPKTKAEAERLVLNAKSPSLSVTSLRPHLIWGPGDNHLAPRLIKSYQAGKLRFIGRSSAKVDAVFIDNAAAAHIQALDQLKPEAAINGKAYFITNQEPWPTEKLINTILASAGLKPLNKRISYGIALLVGGALEFVYGLLQIRKEPPLTKFVVKQLATSHWFSSKQVRQDLRYTPKVSMVEGFEKLRESYQNARTDKG